MLLNILVTVMLCLQTAETQEVLPPDANGITWIYYPKYFIGGNQYYKFKLDATDLV